MYSVNFITKNPGARIMQKPASKDIKREECECEPNTLNGLMGIAKISWKLLN